MANASMGLVASSSQYLSIADASQTGLTITGSFTLECLLNLTSTLATDTTRWIMYKHGNSAGEGGYRWSYLNDAGSFRLRLTIRDGSINENHTWTISELDTSRWYHLAVVWNSSTQGLELWINGVSQATKSGSITSMATNTNPFYFTSDGSSDFIDGKVDEGRVWSGVVRTESLIQQNMFKGLDSDDQTGLVGYWKLDNSLVDETANENTLVNNNGGTYSINVAFFDIDASEAQNITEDITIALSDLSIDVSDNVSITEDETISIESEVIDLNVDVSDNVSITEDETTRLPGLSSAYLNRDNGQFLSITNENTTGLTPTGDLVLETWFNSNSDVAEGEFEYFFDKYSSATDEGGYWLQRRNDLGVQKVRLRIRGNNVTDNFTWNNVSFTNNIWYHISISWDASASQAELFINTVSQGAKTASITAMDTNTEDFYMGCDGSSGCLDGTLAFPRVWTGITRDSADITADYMTYLTGSEPGLVAYWQFRGSFLDETSNDNDLDNNNGATFSLDTPFRLIDDPFESVVVAESTAQEVVEDDSLSIDVNDSISITEDVTIGQDDLSINVNEAVTISESITIGLDDLNIDISDSISITENVEINLNSNINVDDDLTISESVTTSLDISINVLENIIIVDFDSQENELNINVIEDVTIADVPSVAFEEIGALTINVVDNLSIAEDITIALSDLSINVNDSVSISENVSLLSEFNVDVNDGISITEDVSLSLGLNINVNDSVSITEDIEIALESNINVNDSISITENVVTALSDLSINVNDSLSITESVTILVQEIGVLSLSVSEDISIAEDINAVLESSIDVNDSLSITEDVTVSIEVIGILSINVNDGLSISENVITTLSDLSIDINDSISIAEDVTVTLPDLSINTSDSISISESTSIVFEEAGLLSINVGDDISIAESVSVIQSDLSINVNDDISIIDLDSQENEFNINVNDSLSISENVDVVSEFNINVAEVGKEELSISQLVNDNKTTCGDPRKVAQTFKIPDGIEKLTKVELLVYSRYETLFTYNLRIYDSNGSLPEGGTLLATKSATTGNFFINQWLIFELDSEIDVTPGDTYVIWLQGTFGGVFGGQQGLFRSSTSVYSDGVAYENYDGSTWFLKSDRDFAFKVYGKSGAFQIDEDTDVVSEFNINANEGLSINENVSVEVGEVPSLSINVNDSATISENIDIDREVSIDISESVNITEDVSTSISDLNISTSESISITDSPTTYIELPYFEINVTDSQTISEDTNQTVIDIPDLFLSISNDISITELTDLNLSQKYTYMDNVNRYSHFSESENPFSGNGDIYNKKLI